MWCTHIILATVLLSVSASRLLAGETVLFNQQCLYLSDETVGKEIPFAEGSTSLNNDLDFLTMDANSRAIAVTTCFDKKERVTGIQFQVAVEGDVNVEMPMLGHMGKGCKTLTLTNPLTHIEASSNNGVVDSIRWVVNPNQKTFGQFNAQTGVKWTITRSNPVIGLYGQTNEDNEIIYLGFVTTSPDCEEIVGSEQAGETGEMVENEEGMIEPETKGGSMMIIIIVVAVVLLLGVGLLIFCLWKMKQNK